MRGIKGSARVQEPEKMEGKLLVTFPIPGNKYSKLQVRVNRGLKLCCRCKPT